MKSLQINLTIIILFLLASVTTNAQSNKTKSSTEKSAAYVKQRTEAKQQIKLSENLPTKSKPVIISSEPSQAINTPQKNTRVSDYLSMEKKIMSWTIAGDIPASLPKHQEGQTKEQYNAILKNWAKDNLNLIKPEYHQKITSSTK